MWSFYNIDLSCRFFTCELQSQGIFILCMVQYIGVLSISTIHCSPPLSLVGSSYGSTRAFVPFEQQSGRAEIGFNLALSRSLAQDVPAMVGDPIVGQLVHHQVKRLVRRIRSQVPGWRRLWKLVTILVSQRHRTILQMSNAGVNCDLMNVPSKSAFQPDWSQRRLQPHLPAHIPSRPWR